MFGFLTLHVHSLICLSCLHCFLVAVLYDCCLVTCNIKVVCVKSLSVFATMLLCEEIMQSLCTFSLFLLSTFVYCLIRQILYTFSHNHHCL